MSDPRREQVLKEIPELSPKDADRFVAQFDMFDADKSGAIDEEELTAVLKSLEMKASPDEVKKIMADADEDKNGEVDFREFLQVVKNLMSGKSDGDSGFGNVVKSSVKLMTVKGASGTHSFSEEERDAFTDHINMALDGHEKLSSVALPIQPDQFFDSFKDGTLLCALINYTVPGTIDDRVVNWKPKNAYQEIESRNLALMSAKGIGLNIVNIGEADIGSAQPHLLLGVTWQLVRLGLTKDISLASCPELFRLLEEGETLEDLAKLSPEQLLLRWVNYHLKAAGCERRATNFSKDIKDSEIYTRLLHQIKPAECSLAPMDKTDPVERAESMLQGADAIGCRKYVTPREVAKGNSKLNLAFVANLFNTWPSLEPLSAEERAAVDDWLFNSQGTREERTFCLWLNSMGVDPFVNNLLEDLRNGLILLSVMDMVEPGIVDWRKVNKAGKLNKFKIVENVNYVVALGKAPTFRFSLVGIGGTDIADGSKLTLSIVWQLMRHNLLNILSEISGEKGKKPSDKEIIEWANNTVKAKGKTTTMTSFKDASLRNSHFFLDLLDSIRPVVDYQLVNVSDSCSDDEAIMNARYAISIARKLGAMVFVLPEDIVELPSAKLIMTFTAAIMAAAKAQPAA